MPKLAHSASKSAKKKRVRAEMHKFRVGTLRSGSKSGPRVKSREQAVAIALSEAGMARKKPAAAKRKRKRA